ncbi:dual specificity protein phosphatase 22-B-like [Dendronephthya gigantea]|uniref:dual specificity protein phosphatase 22-B-like n=1 Tax=Dendronephthya gigantea TaxID=151771 RepID=UPI00106A34A4|nr:dual specificity protein phosphatase 22-B-like [Dendronephthya gigantea]XP_028409929.1 dual specificity protein phosphatase 22-B-like [Dendronephthya gigantea]
MANIRPSTNIQHSVLNEVLNNTRYIFCYLLVNSEIETMGNGMNKVLPGLYIGNFRDSKDKAQLTSNNITHIVSAHENAKELLQEYKYHCVQAEDFSGQDLTPFFKDSAVFIHKARCEGGNVLVHCLAGISRSTTLTVAYIMAVTDMEWTEILKSVKCSRSVVDPNPGFKRQLNEFGKSEELKALKRELKHDFNNTVFEDENYLRQVIKNMAETEPKLLQEYEEGIDVAAKYCNAAPRTSHGNKPDDSNSDSAGL